MAANQEVGTDPRAGSPQALVLSYLAMRQAVGFIGFFLPAALAWGKMLVQSPGIEESISAYYYTRMGDVFVGSLCAIGVFLASSRGYKNDNQDERAGYLAGALAICVALVPTTQPALPKIDLAGGFHLTFAALFFLTLAYFCLRLFVRTDPNKTPSRRKLQRNIVYRTCGYTIVACILLICVAKLPAVERIVKPGNPVFWLETIAVMAFGLAWITKGETILKDGDV